MRLKDKVCFITGASRGIGKGIALAFAKEGARVIIGYHSNEIAAKKTSEEIDKFQCENITIRFDVVNRKLIKNAVRETLNKFGCIDILVNNAGINMPKTFYEITD
ncbi:unnamed protein product, partial [marine sediment metagenome]